MRFTTLFFDLDATLYPASNGLWDEIRNRIFAFMKEVVRIPEGDIPSIREHYWKTYGTTLQGLRVHHQVDPKDYLSYVHAIDLGKFLQDDPLLRDQLKSLPQDLWVFTNADRQHAERVLAALGIADLFCGIVDLFALDFVVKPNPGAYQRALALAGSQLPSGCMLFDDLLPNLRAAKELGFSTALVGQNGIAAPEADYHLETIHDLKTKLPELWG